MRQPIKVFVCTTRIECKVADRVDAAHVTATYSSVDAFVRGIKKTNWGKQEYFIHPFDCYILHGINEVSTISDLSEPYMQSLAVCDRDSVTWNKEHPIYKSHLSIIESIPTTK